MSPLALVYLSFTCISSQNAISNILNLANIYIFLKCNDTAQNERKKSHVGERVGHCSLIGIGECEPL